MTLIRYLVMLHWRDSGKTYYYCAVASDTRDAIALVVNGRDSAVSAAEAWEWPPSMGGPRVKLETPRGFRLKDERTIDAALLALRQTTAQAPRPSQASSPGGDFRPGAGASPWREARAKPLSASRERA